MEYEGHDCQEARSLHGCGAGIGHTPTPPHKDKQTALSTLLKPLHSLPTTLLSTSATMAAWTHQDQGWEHEQDLQKEACLHECMCVRVGVYVCVCACVQVHTGVQCCVCVCWVLPTADPNALSICNHPHW